MGLSSRDVGKKVKYFWDQTFVSEEDTQNDLLGKIREFRLTMVISNNFIEFFLAEKIKGLSKPK